MITAYFRNLFVSLAVVLSACSARGQAENALSTDSAPDLIKAIRTNDLAKVRLLLSERAEPNLLPGKTWDYPIIEACGSKDLGLVKLLVEAGANVSVQSTRAIYGSTPLGVALNTRRADIAEYLIKKGASSDGTTRLMLAVIAKDLPEVKIQIESGSDVNVRNRFGMTALDYAHPNRDHFSLLLKAGARHKFSQIELAAILDDPQKVSRELKALAPVDVVMAKRALHRAIEFNSIAVIKVFLEGKPDLGVDESGQLTALGVAAKFGRVEITKLLLAAGANPNGRCDGVLFPFQIAQAFGHTDCALLLERAARLQLQK